MASVTGRYARAYAEVVTAQSTDPDQAVEELNQIAGLIHENSDLHHIFLNPAVEHKQKLGLLDAIIDRTGGMKLQRRLLRNFVAVLIDHKRIGQITQIAEQFKEEIQERMGIAEARVSSARELTTGQKKTLEQRLVAVTGKKIRATYAEDLSLLGGAVVRIGSTIYDGSVKGRLERLRVQIAGD